jgi:hypothetical protein
MILTPLLSDWTIPDTVDHNNFDPMVHRGWYRAALSSMYALENKLVPLIKKYPNASILFPGHSSSAGVGALSCFLAFTKGGFLYNKFPRNKVDIVSLGGKI